jgi:nucleotide-binding universal stress UspA family protein
MKNKIIVPTDLTEVSDHAIKQGVAIAKKSRMDIVLLYVLEDKSRSIEELEKIFQPDAAAITKETGVNCGILIKKGSFYDIVSEEACEGSYDLMVIGTNRIKGIRQILFGADILKLAMKVPMPVLVVQKESPLIEEFHRLILPVSSHEHFQPLIDAVGLFANVFGSEVHFYSIHKAGFNWPEHLLKNIEEATRQFEARNIKMIRIKEDANLYEFGYARQTLKYAGSAKADLLCVMSLPSKDYYYFAQTDKETLLTNEFHIPVLFAGGNC